MSGDHHVPHLDVGEEAYSKRVLLWVTWLSFSQWNVSSSDRWYPDDDCRLVFSDARERRLRSTASWTCVMTLTYSRAFAAAGPGLSNSLSSHQKEAELSYN